MAVAVISDEKGKYFELEVKKISSIGFECLLPLADFPAMRDDSGRICDFNFSLSFDGSHTDIEGIISVHSMRRITQTEGILCCRFVNLSEEQRSILCEYLTTGKIVSIKKARFKKRA